MFPRNSAVLTVRFEVLEAVASLSLVAKRVAGSEIEEELDSMQELLEKAMLFGSGILLIVAPCTIGSLREIHPSLNQGKPS